MSRRSRKMVDTIDEVSSFIHNNSVSLTHTHRFTETFVLHEIKPKNYAQESVFDSFHRGNHLILQGSAGTGKSYISLYLAIRKAMEDDHKNVLIVRSAVQTREIGHTPGTLEEKEDLYAQPYKDIVNKLFHTASAWNEMKKNGKVDFASTSFLRGLTFDDTILILDEAQNLSWSEINTVMSRVGKGSQLIVCGDVRQTDLHKKNDVSGWGNMMQVMNRMQHVDIINFLPADCVRSGFCKDWVLNCEELNMPLS